MHLINARNVEHGEMNAGCASL